MSRYRFLSSVQGFRTFAAVALALFAAAAMPAHAALTWTKGSYTVASWQAAENNVLNKATCGTSALAALADGKLVKFSTSGGDGNISNNQVLEQPGGGMDFGVPCLRQWAQRVFLVE